MILAERLCLLALNPETGAAYAALDRKRFLAALAGLVLIDLLATGQFVREREEIRLVDSMPLAHPVLAEAARKLAASGASSTISEATNRLARFAGDWQVRITRGLVARDLLELSTPFPFMRRYRLRSRQAWNECVDPLKAFAGSGTASDATVALALATHAASIIGELLDPETARALLARLPNRHLPIAADASGQDWLRQIIAPQ